MQMTESSLMGHALVELGGEVDLLYASALRATLQRNLEQRCPNLIVDLGAVTFIDSSGLSELIGYQQAAAAFGGNLLIAAPGREIRALFEVARLDSFFRIYASSEEACEQAVCSRAATG